MVESLVSLCHQVLIKIVLVLTCLPLNQTVASQETCSTNFVFQQQELLRSWMVGLKTPTFYAATAEVTELNNSFWQNYFCQDHQRDILATCDIAGSKVLDTFALGKLHT